MRFTKLIATIGPACDHRLHDLIRHGIDVARLNFSHGDYNYFSKIIKKIRSIDSSIPILLDTKGPEVRIGDIEPIKINKGDIITLAPPSKKFSGLVIPLTYANFAKNVKKGDKLLIDDGKLILIVKEIDGKNVVCTAFDSFILLKRKSVDVLGGHIDLPDVTLHDKRDIAFGVKQGVDIIAVSLVRSAKTVKQVRRLAPDQFIIAKIENPLAIKNFDAILKASDGIMIARGDLGLTVPTEDVPILQKEIIEKCNLAGKPVIVATQMLESMTVEPMPTRAEVTDVANAVFDGADALMLSGETASGNFPIESVKMMHRIAVKADHNIKHKPIHIHTNSETMVESICVLITEATDEMNIKAIIAPTKSGFTPRLLAKYRPKIPIIAVTHCFDVSRPLNLSKGVCCFICNHKNVHKQISNTIDDIVELHSLKPNDLVILVYNNSEQVGTTNVFEIRKVKELM